MPGVEVKVECRQLDARARSGRRVLVVDDHAGFRSCARALLESEGFDVVGEAAEGASAASLAAELVPDLVVLDIQLPDLDGFTVAQRLLEVDPQLRIVLVSSRDRSSYGSRIEQSGALGFVQKADLSGAELARILE